MMIQPVRTFASEHGGATLLMTITLCALLCLLCLGMLLSSRRNLGAATDRIAQRQAEWAAFGALRLAKAALEADPSRTVDHPSEPWGQPIGPIPIGPAVCSIQVTDLQARINLNNLDLNRQPGPRPFTEVVRTFLAVCDLPSPLQTAQAARDWVDQNSEGWAESGVYENRTPSHSSKNTPLDDKGELRWIEGWPSAFWRKVPSPRTLEFEGAPADMVTLLPHVAGSLSWTTINLNTAPLPVLLAVLGAGQKSAASAITQLRQDRAILTVETIAPLLPPAVLDGARPWIDVRSDYYRVHVESSAGPATVNLTADLNRLSSDRNLGLRAWIERRPDLFEPADATNTARSFPGSR